MTVDVRWSEVESPIACPTFSGDLVDSVETDPCCLLLVISNEVVQIIQGLALELHPLVGMLRPQELKNPEDALLIFAVIRPIHHSLV